MKFEYTIIIAYHKCNNSREEVLSFCKVSRAGGKSETAMAHKNYRNTQLHSLTPPPIFIKGGLEGWKIFLKSEEARSLYMVGRGVLTPYEDPHIAYPCFFKFCPPLPATTFLSPPTPAPTVLSAVLFLWLSE